MNISYRASRLVGGMVLAVSAQILAPMPAMSVTVARASGAAHLMQVTLTAEQVGALGIQTQALEINQTGVVLRYPATAMVTSEADLVISSPLDGVVQQILVQQNQKIAKGSPLLRIASSELGTLQLQLLQAHTRAMLAEQAARREKQLYDEGIIARRRWEEAEAARTESQAALRQAQAALRLTGMSNAMIERLLSSGNPQDHLIVAAPMTGVVAEVSVKAGQRVDMATPLLRLVQTGNLWLDMHVPAADIVGHANSQRWQVGSTVRVVGREVSGNLVSVGSTVDANNQSVMVRAQVKNAGGAVRPGEVLTVELAEPVRRPQSVRSAESPWLVPQSALMAEGDHTYVLVRNSTGFEVRPVQVVTSAGQQVSVKGTFKAGEQLAIRGLALLKSAWLKLREAP